MRATRKPAASIIATVSRAQMAAAGGKSPDPGAIDQPLDFRLGRLACAHVLEEAKVACGSQHPLQLGQCAHGIDHRAQHHARDS
jgi:hypothetical protein